MGDDIDLEIFVDVNKTGRLKLINEVVNAILRKGAVIDERFPPSGKDLRDIEGPLDHVKSVVSEEGGSINFVYKDFGFYFFYYQETPHELIGITCSKSYFTKRDGYKFVRYFVDFSKLIWNAATGEKIYGLADLDDYVHAFREGSDKFDLREPTRWWINFYGQKLIEKIGLKNIAADGDYNMENVKDGVMLITKKIPNQIA